MCKEASCDETEHSETFFMMFKKSKKALMPDGSQFQFVPSPLRYTSYKTIHFLLVPGAILETSIY